MSRRDIQSLQEIRTEEQLAGRAVEACSRWGRGELVGGDLCGYLKALCSAYEVYRAGPWYPDGCLAPGPGPGELIRRK
jgi:hypothetical protein